MTLAQDHLATLRKAIGGVLRTQGFRVRSKREWIRGDDDGGWVLITWWGDKWNTKASAEALLTATVWPAGTREHVSEVFGSRIEVTGGDGPVFSADRDAAGTDLVGVDTFRVTATMSPEAVAALAVDAKAYAASLATWAESMLDARVSASRMRHDYAVAALLAQAPDDPRLDETLDRLTARFQRDPRPIWLGRVIVRWRRERGLVEAPLPPWSRYASRRTYDIARVPSPRDAVLAGLGTKVPFDFADGTTRLPEPEDLPDVAVLARWREEVRRSPLPDGVLLELPEWLPYVTWLDPEPEHAPTDRRRWRR